MTLQDLSAPPDVSGKGLRSGAVGLVSSVVIGMASTAPAYSFAATLGFIVLAGVGVKAPAVMLLAFVPMACIAVAYREFNRVEPDCGTSFTWITRVFGPKLGWLSGWAAMAAQVLVMASQAEVAGRYSLLLFGADELASNRVAVTAVGVVWIVALTYLCYRGIELSAKVQFVLLVVELVVLLGFAVAALWQVATGTAGPQAIRPEWDWLLPTDVPAGGFVSALLLAVFVYWGWESSASINEESHDPQETPGRAILISTVLLVTNYVFVTVAVVAYAGVGSTGIGLANEANADDVLAGLGPEIFGTGAVGTIGALLLVVSVLTSAAATTQTTILPAARSSLSMASHGAIPEVFARVHPRFRSPSVSTWTVGGASIAVYLMFSVVSTSVLGDSVDAVGLLIAFYYGLLGLACPWFFRRTLFSGARAFLLRGLVPGFGGVVLLAAFFLALREYSDPGYGMTSVAGIGTVAVIGVAGLLLGLPLLVWLHRRYPSFYRGERLPRWPVPGKTS
ncbi:APC family permease [Saccharopolyspora rosea]|uniref:APC family permease n=1 Tax=Saccharopolyspora rosea TaxID=524884 RepID=A0ABW3FR71_9PSEU|nr:APC family permease [Saccharopolyspora rosea]